MQTIRLFFLLSILFSTFISFSQKLTIKAVGDIMMGSYTPRIVLPQEKGKVFCDSLGQLLQGSDITFGNLEGVFVTKDIKPQKCSEASRNAKRCYEFGMPHYLAPNLKELGFTVLSMDNNHNSDYGTKGVSYTKELLDSLSIHYAAKKSPKVIEVNGKKIGVIAFGHSSISYHVSHLTTAKNVVTELDKQCDIVLVSFHGGAEGTKAQHVYNKKETYYGEDRGNLVQFAKTVIDAGADVVIGHGPHVLRGIDLYKNKLIMYSLGNFLTHGNVNITDIKGIGAIMDIEIDAESGDFVKSRIIPTKQVGRGIPVFDKTGRSISVIRKLTKSDFPSSPLIISDDGSVEKKS